MVSSSWTWVSLILILPSICLSWSSGLMLTFIKNIPCTSFYHNYLKFLQMTPLHNSKLIYLGELTTGGLIEFLFLLKSKLNLVGSKNITFPNLHFYLRDLFLRPKLHPWWILQLFRNENVLNLMKPSKTISINSGSKIN
jgi:hypothetical protein